MAHHKKPLKRLLKRHPHRKVGAAPGALIHVGEPSDEEVTLDVIHYDADRFTEDRPDIAHAQGLAPPAPGRGVVWIGINGIHQVEHIATIGRRFGLHPLVLEDILNSDHRPKLEDYGDYLFLVLKVPFTDPGNGVRTEQLSLIVGASFLLCFQESGEPLFDTVRERLRNDKSRIRSLGPDFLAYSLIDSVVDRYFIVLEQISDAIEALEQELFAVPGTGTVEAIHAFKREMILLRKSVWPLRELLGSLQRGDSKLIGETTRFFLRDVYDHSVQVVDTVETFRDVISGMLDLYISSIGFRTNEVMKVLTIVSTIFIPVTFVAGVYGMNFEYMPELKWHWGYFTVLGAMLVMALGMLILFRLKRWF